MDNIDAPGGDQPPRVEADTAEEAMASAAVVAGSNGDNGGSGVLASYGQGMETPGAMDTTRNSGFASGQKRWQRCRKALL
ncbi:hypothetical protein RHMOL_Rhmol01G0126500 [Rhododendron molle]|uniref:Uncharacterized protein n=1 Tax=Rhododendron molle TaxID=49168 RepID=A0ACC0Q2P3_RHOML|nr:hypothetical protein RHMOL_Rhmol01G0126500 [Rhododendron molle]